MGQQKDVVHFHHQQPAQTLGVASSSTNSSIGNVGISSSTTPWRWQMDSHVYAIAIVWFLLALYVFVVGINLRAAAPYKSLLCRICVILCLSSILRAVYLMVEPYESKHKMTPWISRLLYVSALPPLIFSFIFVFYALLRLTKVRMRFYPLQSSKALTIIMFIYLLLLAGFETLYQHFATPTLPFYALVLSTFLLWTVGMCAAYFRYGFLMLRSLAETPEPPPAAPATTKTRYQMRGATVMLTAKDGTPLPIPLDLAPKIRITDENECTYSYKSENVSPALSEQSASTDSYDDDEDDFDDSLDRDKLAVPGGSCGGGRGAATNGSVATNNNAKGPSGENLGKFANNMTSIKRKMMRNNKKNKKKRKKPRLPRKGRGAGGLSSSTRMTKIKRLIKQTFVPASFCLIQCGWLTYEMYHKFSPTPTNGSWKWLVVVTIFRLTEIVLAGSVAVLTRRGFNSL